MNKIFEDNKGLKAYWKTSDGTPFYNENTANIHAKSLEDKKVEKVERPASSKADKTANTTVPVKKALKAMNKTELLAEAAPFNIDTEGKSNPELVILIEGAMKDKEEKDAAEKDAKNGDNK
jgi:hypothetical protein